MKRSITIRLAPLWAGWLRALAKRDGVTPTAWVRRHVKVAIQCDPSVARKRKTP